MGKVGAPVSACEVSIQGLGYHAYKSPIDQKKYLVSANQIRDECGDKGGDTTELD